MGGPLGSLGGAMIEQQTAKCASSSLAYTPSLQDRMDRAVQEAEARLAAVREAREILTRNPDIERLLNIMQSVHF